MNKKVSEENIWKMGKEKKNREKRREKYQHIHQVEKKE